MKWADRGVFGCSYRTSNAIGIHKAVVMLLLIVARVSLFSIGNGAPWFRVAYPQRALDYSAHTDLVYASTNLTLRFLEICTLHRIPGLIP